MANARGKDVRYRELRSEELTAATDLYLDARDDMLARNGLVVPVRTGSEKLTYEHIARTGVFHVAEVDGRLAAICLAIVRSWTWFLSGFWVRPGLQRHGIGGPMLRRVYEEGARRGATSFFTWSSVERDAVGGYLKLGLLPGYPVLRFAGRPHPDRTALGEFGDVPSLEHCRAMDEEILLRSRDFDHTWWRSQGAAFEIVGCGALAGYAYVHDGQIGPVAWGRDCDGESVIRTAVMIAADQADTVRISVPGVNYAAIRAALAVGLKVEGYGHLLTHGPLGSLERYVPSGPLLF